MKVYEAIRILEKMPAMQDIRKFDPETLTWKEIDEIGRSGTARYTLGLGSTKTVTLKTGEKIRFQIIGFDHDDLADGSGKAPISWFMVDALEEKRLINPCNNNDGWGASGLRHWINVNLFYQLPDDLQLYIKHVIKKTSAGGKSTEIIETVDELWLPSYTEMNFPHDTIYSPGGEGNPYPLFISDASRIKKCNGSANCWWLRSPYAANATSFDIVYSDGSYYHYYASIAAFAVVAGFCI